MLPHLDTWIAQLFDEEAIAERSSAVRAATVRRSGNPVGRHGNTSSGASCSAGCVAARCRAAGITTKPITGAWLATEYALANNSDHPKALYLRESAVLPEPDRWIAPGPKPAKPSLPAGVGRDGLERQRCLDKSLAEQLDRPSTPRSYAS